MQKHTNFGNDKKRKTPYQIEKFHAHTFHYFQPNSTCVIDPIIKNDIVVNNGGSNDKKKVRLTGGNVNNGFVDTGYNNAIEKTTTSINDKILIDELFFQLNSNRISIDSSFFQFQRLNNLINSNNNLLLQNQQQQTQQQQQQTQQQQHQQQSQNLLPMNIVNGVNSNNIDDCFLDSSFFGKLNNNNLNIQIPLPPLSLSSQKQFNFETPSLTSSSLLSPIINFNEQPLINVDQYSYNNNSSTH